MKIFQKVMLFSYIILGKENLFYDATSFFGFFFWPIFIMNSFISLFAGCKDNFKTVFFLLISGASVFAMCFTPIYGARSSLYLVYYVLVVSGVVVSEIDINKYLVKGNNEIFIIVNSMYESSSKRLKMESGFIGNIMDEDNNLYFYTSKNTESRLSLNYKSGKDVLKFGNNIAYSTDFKVQNNGYDGFKESLEFDYDYLLVKRPCKMVEVLDNIPSTLKAQGAFKVDESLPRNEKLLKAWLSHRYISDISDKSTRPEFPKDPTEFNLKDENIYLVFDLLKESVGYISFDLYVDEDTDLEISYGEHLDDLRVRSKIGYRNFTSIIHLSKGHNIFIDYLNRIAGRYIQAFFYTPKVKINYFGLKEVMYPVDVLELKTDNLLRKMIYDTSIRTLKLCMHEHYEDCPWREQSLYAMDSRNQMLAGYYSFKEYEFPRANIELLFKRLHKDGQLLLTAPSEDFLNIPCFTLVSYLALYEYTTFSKDITLLESLKEKLDSIIKIFINRIDKDIFLIERFPDDDGNRYWNFYEWTEGMWNLWGDHELPEGVKEYPLCLNAFLALALDNYIKLLEILNLDSRYYKGVLNKLKKAIDNNFYSESEKAYAGYIRNGELSYFNELSNSMALYIKIGSEERRKIVADKLKGINSNLTPMTLSMMIYKYDALIEFDESNIEFVLNDIDNIWGSMIKNGATTFYETIVGADDFDFAGSLCHGWSAIPAYYYKKYLEK